MGKKVITDEDYVDVIKRLDYVKSEEEILKKLNESNNYNAHVDLPGSFGELLIYLKRRNSYIDECLELFAKIIINTFSLDIYYKDLVDILVTEGIDSKYLVNWDIYSKYQDIKFLIEEKKANDRLYDYIEGLYSEKNNLISLRNKYESKTRKKSTLR